MNNSSPLWERIIAIILASGVLLTFVLIIFNPQQLNTSTFAIIRFLAAFTAAVAGFLFIGTLELSVNLNKGIIKGTGAFAIFIAVFLLFYHELPSDSNQDFERKNSGLEPGLFRGSYSSNFIDYRHLTGNNEYPVLSFVATKFPEEFNYILGLETPPIIQSKNPVYESIQKFRNESGNKDLVSRYLTPSGYEYTYHDNDRTIVANEQLNASYEEKTITKEVYEKKIFNQNSEEYENEIMNRDGEGNEFTYAPIYAELQSSLNDAKWTSIMGTDVILSALPDQSLSLGKISASGGSILQFPKLLSLKYDDKMPNAVHTWIKKVISENPNQRGLVGYTYSYLDKSLISKFKSPENFFLDPCGMGPSVSRLTASPYIRFLDIWNPSDLSMNLESMELQMISKNSYKLTEVDQRDQLFNKISTKESKIKIRISPNQHLLIPTEFGFDNRAIELGDYLNYFNFDSNSLSKIINKALYVSRPYLKPFNNEPNLEKITNTISLDKDFTKSTTSIDSLINSIPKRLAVGSIININSITVNGRKITIDPPLNEPEYSLSAYFAYGSCPYLLVLDSDDKPFRKLGTILTGVESEKSKQTKLYRLNDRPLKVKIEERDPEITYLDSLSFIYQDTQTQELKEVFYPLAELQKIDQQYFLLHQRESLEIDLNKILPDTASNIKLKINGYYELI